MVPGCRTDVDKTMEENFLEQSKSYVGASGATLSGITWNNAAYQQWVLATHDRPKFLATFSMADMSGSDTCCAHKDTSKAELERSQQYAQMTVDAFSCSFLCLFDLSLDKNKLYNVSSGAVVSDDITEVLLKAEEKSAKSKS